MSFINKLTDIPLRKLFIVTVACKIGSSFLAWRLSAPWSFGFAIPLAFMAAYIILGINRRSSDVSDAKFGDSCYYLGFIFTISSIAFCLFDIPDLDKAGRLSDVAVRFGAAMVSTFLGFSIRVYLVGFRRESTDALESLEHQIVESANTLRARLELSEEAFRTFEEKIRQSANDAEARVNMAAENMGQHLSQEMSATLKSLAVDAHALHSRNVELLQETAALVVTELSKYSASLVSETTRAQEHFVGFSRDLSTNFGLIKEDLVLMQGSVKKSTKSLSAALAKLDADLTLPNSVLSLVNKQELIAKEVIAAISEAGGALRSSLVTIEQQNATSKALLDRLVATHGTQAQILGGTTQIVQLVANAQSTQRQTLEGLARVIKQLEQLPADIKTIFTIARAPSLVHASQIAEAKSPQNPQYSSPPSVVTPSSHKATGTIPPSMQTPAVAPVDETDLRKPGLWSFFSRGKK